MSFRVLGDIVKIKGGKRLPKSSQLQVIKNDHPYIRVRDMGERYLPRNGLEYVPDNVFPSISRYIVNTNDLILSIVGTVGLVSIVDEYFNNASLTENCVKLTGLDEKDAKYLYYYLLSQYGKEEIKARTVGAVQPKLPLYNIEKIQIRWFDKLIREKIVTCLSTLDDKIQLNNQTNQTLESIAQAIFKSWFIDFEPVRAKIAAKQNGEDPEIAAMCVISGKSEEDLKKMAEEDFAELQATAALFPDELVESELGEVPRGWFKTDLSILADLNVQSWTKKNCPEKVTYVDLSNTKWGVIQQTEEFIFEKAPSRARRVLKIGDTIVGTVRPANGSYAFIQRENLTGSTGFAVLSPKHKNYAEFIYIVATDKENIKRLAHLADGGAYPAVSYDTVLNTPCILPIENKDGVLNLFHKNVKEFYLLSASKFEENNILASIRDTLLPKLLSGELDVSCVQDEVA
ncbi:MULTISPECIES: restriction endonuclease subunit S [Acinetobacter]|uniref:restriction endonuclease subunit S n=1 Tax=Acinetobacter TaxID=469 RepID=UPI0001BBA646|nr:MULTISPECIES: restriction endonuclease subunit S [Acinetobacter]EEY88789.1 type I restriction modification DNA specificity domain protein [Acinetobacter lwoffii SH145]UXI51958.1 restriction endonuclease subunit S [Acinetobacter variabilis]